MAENLRQLQTVLTDLRSVLRTADQYRYSSDERTVSETRGLLEDVMLALAHSKQEIDDTEELDEVLDELLKVTNDYLEMYTSKLDQFETAATVERPFSFAKRLTGNVGRPKLQVDEEQICHLKSLGFSWIKVANIVGISKSTLDRARASFSTTISNYCDISDLDLDSLVAEEINRKPDIGERMLSGTLLSKGIKVQRWRMRRSMDRVRPNRNKFAGKKRIFRRVYNVKGPNLLW